MWHNLRNQPSGMWCCGFLYILTDPFEETATCFFTFKLCVCVCVCVRVLFFLRFVICIRRKHKKNGIFSNSRMFSAVCSRFTELLLVEKIEISNITVCPVPPCRRSKPICLYQLSLVYFFGMVQRWDGCTLDPNIIILCPLFQLEYYLDFFFHSVLFVAWSMLFILNFS